MKTIKQDNKRKRENKRYLILLSILALTFAACGSRDTETVDETSNHQSANSQQASAVENNAENFEIEGDKLVRYIGEEETVVIPSGITSIGTYAFIGKRDFVKEIIVPNSVTTIDEMAFVGCNLLEKIDLPTSITEIGKSAFKNTPWYERIQKNDDVIVINNILYDLNGQTGDIKIPEGVTYIPEDFFGYKGMSSITLPESLTDIADAAFLKCRDLEKVVFLGDDCYIGTGAFEECTKLTDVQLSFRQTVIPEGAFRSCKALTRIRLPEELESIGPQAFSNCEKLTAITLPETVESVDSTAFDGSMALVKITVPSELELEEDSFKQNSTELALYGIKGAKAESYAEAHNIPFYYLEMQDTTLTLKEGDTYQLALNSDAVCEWKTLDEDIVSVDEYGMLKAEGTGTTTIAAWLYGERYTCEVTVQ